MSRLAGSPVLGDRTRAWRSGRSLAIRSSSPDQQRSQHRCWNSQRHAVRRRRRPLGLGAGPSSIDSARARCAGIVTVRGGDVDLAETPSSSNSRAGLPVGLYLLEPASAERNSARPGLRGQGDRQFLGRGLARGSMLGRPSPTRSSAARQGATVLADRISIRTHDGATSKSSSISSS